MKWVETSGPHSIRVLDISRVPSRFYTIAINLFSCQRLNLYAQKYAVLI